MKFKISMVSLIVANYVCGVGVDWNKAFILVDPDWSGNHDAAISIGAPPYLPTWGDRLPAGWRLLALTDTFMEYANVFVLAAAGDVVDSAYMQSKKSYFYYSEYGVENSGRTDYAINVLIDDPVFLAFRNETMSAVTYGWLELTVNGDGNLSVVSSAWNRNGLPIMVGVVPEPSGIMLLLLGCVGLLMKRPRQNSGI